MANELTVSIRTRLANGSLNDRPPNNTFQVDQANAGIFRDVQSVTTSDTAVPTGNIATLGWAKFKNLDDTNYVNIGPDSGGSIVDMIRLEPGEECTFRIEPGITLRWQANTAACEVDFTIYED